MQARLNSDLITTTRHVAAAIGVRLVLVLLGAGDALVWQPEVTTPANTLLKVREGLALLRLGVSPYSGDACHVPPLWLALCGPVAQHPVLFVVPNILADLAAAAALYAAASALFSQPSSQAAQQPHRDAPWLSARQLALCYLFNPFAVLSCVAGTLTSAENAAVLVAVAGGCLRNGPLVGAGLAAGAYLGLHPLLLLVPLLLMLWRGAEDPLQAVPLQLEGTISSSGGGGSSGSSSRQQAQAGATPVAGVTTRLRSRQGSKDAAVEQQQQDLQQQAAKQDGGAEQPTQQQQKQQHSIRSAHRQQHSLAPCLWCISTFALCAAALLLLSDQVLQRHPSSQCLAPVASGLWGAAAGSSNSSTAVVLRHLPGCWAGRVYSLTLFLQDLTPNIGLWWYFFTEVFKEFQPFFLFVFHSFPLALVAPLTLRFQRRPLFAAWATLFVCCMFKPYACVGDMVPWMALLPLLQQQLQSLKLRMFLVSSFVLLLVLGPAMWHQWIVVDSANANFFYSITLLLGVWYTVLLMQMLRLTVLLDRWLAGKGPPPSLTGAPCQGTGPAPGVKEYAAAVQARVLQAKGGAAGQQPVEE